jgi:glycosyltransferase involved in cell wall biosynthesis
MELMRILIISDIPPYVTGGAEQQTWLLAKAWTDLGHKVEIFGHRIPNKIKPLDNDQKIVLRHINVAYSLGKLFRALTYFVSLSVLLLRYKKRFDIIYCRFLGEAALSVILLKKLKLVNLSIICVPAAAGNKDNADLAIIHSLPFSSKLKEVINLNCDCLNFISSKIEESMNQEGIQTKHISRIPNGVKVPAITNTSEFKKPSKLLFVGRLSKQKGLDVFLQALSQLAKQGFDFSCRIIGDGPESKTLKESVISLNLSQQITFLGRLTNELAQAEMLTAHYFILPSRYEGMSNAALEALACGLPCVLTRCGGIDNCLPNHTAFLCEPNNQPSLQKALENALTADISTWRQMSDESRQFIANAFSIETIAQRNIELFEAINC